MNDPNARDLDADDAMCAAATPGEWYWSLSPRMKSVSLEAAGRRHWRETVMGFKRWGFSGATATFRTSIADEFHELRPLHAYGAPIPGREHHADWALDVTHPDARFMAESRSALPYWLAEVRRLRARVAELEASP